MGKRKDLSPSWISRRILLDHVASRRTLNLGFTVRASHSAMGGTPPSRGKTH